MASMPACLDSACRAFSRLRPCRGFRRSSVNISRA
jgi:hypothetical protein